MDTSLAFSIPRTVGHQSGSDRALAFECGAAPSLFAGRLAPIRARAAHTRMPERCCCQSGGRRFGVLRMPETCPQLCLGAGVTEALMNVWFSGPLLWLLSSGPAEASEAGVRSLRAAKLCGHQSDSPAGAKPRRSATRIHRPRQDRPKVRFQQPPKSATGRSQSEARRPPPCVLLTKPSAMEPRQ